MQYDELVERLKQAPQGFPFVTQYVNADWKEEFHKKQTTLFFKNLWDDVEGRLQEEDAPNNLRRSVKQDRERIQEYLRDAMRGTVDAGYRGLAFFASSGSGFFEVFRSPVPFEDQLVVDEGPQLRQLAHQADEYERMMVVMVDSSRSRIYELNLAGIESSRNIMDDVPSRHRAGGYSQLRFQRHVDVHRAEHHKDTADAAVKLHDDENLKHVVLAGQDDVIATFSKFLPKRVLDNVISTVRLDMNEHEDKIVRIVIDQLQRDERVRENRGVRQAINRAAAGSKGSVGLLATLKAINAQGVQTLYLSMSFKRHGGRCTNCGKLYSRSQMCIDCDEELEPVDLAEAMVNAVIAAGGTVDVVKRSPELDSFEGVAAITRFEMAPL